MTFNITSMSVASCINMGACVLATCAATLRASCIPEPGVVMYGRVLDRDTGEPVAVESLIWTIGQLGPAGELVKTVPFTLEDEALCLATMDSTTHYLLQIPFVSWVDFNGDGAVDANDVDASERRFRFSAGTPFTRYAQANGVEATITGGVNSVFIFPTQNVPLERGTVVRVDLIIDRSGGSGNPVSELGLVWGDVLDGQLTDTTLSWIGESGGEYTIEYSNDLAADSWIALGGASADLAGNASFEVPDNLPVPVGNMRFFRVRRTDN